MTTPATVYTRSVGWILLIAAVLVLALALDRQDANEAERKSVQALQQQWRRVQTPQGTASGAVAEPMEDLVAVAAQAQAWREAAQNRGSEARNTAYVLERTKRICEASGLKDCQVRRTGAKVAAQGPAAMVLVPHAVNVVARFDARGVEQFSRGLLASDLLFRVERVHIVQARAEWDLVFLFQSGERP